MTQADIDQSLQYWKRRENGYELAELDGATLFGGNELGYIDYPTHEVL